MVEQYDKLKTNPTLQVTINNRQAKKIAFMRTCGLDPLMTITSEQSKFLIDNSASVSLSNYLNKLCSGEVN